MSAESRKALESPAQETPVSPGWDPFTVWRERVYKPGSKARAARTADVNPPLTVLDPFKQRG
jgi:hypothetical protein